MAVRQKIISLLKCFCFALVFGSGVLSAADAPQILYHIARGEIEIACGLYTQFKKDQNREDPVLLQELGFRLLREGIDSYDPEVQILSLWGAGISGDDRALSILEKGLLSRNPNLQMAAVQFLVEKHHDAALKRLDLALTSPFLPVRLKALSGLINNRSPKALAHLESLMQKVTPETRVVFVKMLVEYGGTEATRVLKKILAIADEQTSVSAILAIAQQRRDDLIPEIRRFSGYLNAAQQEACAHALGAFKDMQSLPRLKSLARSPVMTVRLAALSALYHLGNSTSRLEMEALAKEGQLFAIQALGEIEGGEETLRALLESPVMNIRLNAALTLLHLGHPLTTELYQEIFIQDHRDIVFVPLSSPGKTFTSWSAIPCAAQRFSDVPEVLENSLRFRQMTLLQALDISEQEAVSLSRLLFEKEQNDLVPVLTRTLAEIKSPKLIQQLKIYREKAGAPWIRDYCNRALYSAKTKGPYAAELMSWIKNHSRHDLICLKPPEVWNRGTQDFYLSISPEGTSQLLLESIEAMIQVQDKELFPLLLDLIRYGNPKNRYALAGILIRAAQ